MMLATLQTKYCPGCEKDLPIGEFSKNRSAKDGLQAECKECRSRYMEKYYRKNPERIKQRSARYRGENRSEYLGKQKVYFNTLEGRLARIFGHLNRRCNNPAVHNYKNYGGRGIRNNFKSSTEFVEYVINELHVDPRGLQVDRIDNDGNYERGNIRFVTAKVNMNNQECSKK
ncbi:hypothetical protein LCGC14_0536150 [marine sediment metagenome]|uniref:Uncharacterized protein n=1 Tax=marine sediment metagenome TaxID=412755 RepID=A0A0F9V2C2_9ZZZZ